MTKKELGATAKEKVAAALAKIREKQAKLDAEAKALASEAKEAEKAAKASEKAEEKPAVEKADKAETAPKKRGRKRSTPKAVKDKAAAKADKPKKDKKPHTGQSGPEIDGLEYDALNAKEKKLVDFLAAQREDNKPIVSIEDMAKVFSRSADNEKQANSWTRNALRRLVRGHLVEKVERGSYRLTRRGTNQAA